MTRKVKTYTYNVSCGIDVQMMKKINDYIGVHHVSRSRALRHILQRGISAMLDNGGVKKHDK